MKFEIDSKENSFDVSSIAEVKGAWVDASPLGMIVYLGCDSGDEKKVFGKLPQWVHEAYKVTRSINSVFLEEREEDAK